MQLLLKSVHVVDPVAGRNGDFDVLIEGGRLVRVEKNLPAGDARVVELPRGFIVTPGLIDIHVHLREPGQEHKETVATGTASAVAGGFTAVACMPNTTPVNDSASVTEFILKRAAEANLARVYPIGAVSMGSKGTQLTEIGDLVKAGCVAITDDGRPVETALLMRRALEYASMFGIPVIDHCEDPSLKGDGVAHEGPTAAMLGLKGIPGAAESIMVERDISVAELTGGRVHIAHMSARQSLRAVREGKARGVNVTSEVCPHHFLLTDEALRTGDGYDTNFKMNPPLREEADRAAMMAGLVDGSIDVIATDHAPHHADEKALEFDRAPFGIVGLETAVSLCLDRLVHAGVISMNRMVELLSPNPARALGLPGGTLADGAPADITILAPDASVTVRASAFKSRGRNTPFEGWTLKGGVAATIVGGRVVYVNEPVLGRASL
ncbi:MAG: dihydroorotase [Acidobacteria bacterium]|nr:dihydroorotase [Acidobacteriota bacterium]